MLILVHSHVMCIKYYKTFSLVVRFDSIHFILTFVAQLDLELFQMDVRTSLSMENQMRRSI